MRPAAGTDEETRINCQRVARAAMRNPKYTATIGMFLVAALAAGRMILEDVRKPGLPVTKDGFDHTSSHTSFSPTPAPFNLDYDFIHKHDVIPPFVDLMRRPTTEIFNISKVFPTTSLDGMKALNQRDWTSGQKLARIFFQQHDENFVRNEGDFAGVENVADIANSKLLMVEFEKAKKAGKDSKTAMREAFINFIAREVSVHSSIGIVEMNLYPGFNSSVKMEDNSPDKMEAFIAELKRQPQFLEDAQKIYETLDPKILEKLSAELKKFDSSKLAKPTAAPSPLGLAVPSRYLGGRNNKEMRDSEDRRFKGKMPSGGGKFHGGR